MAEVFKSSYITVAEIAGDSREMDQAAKEVLAKVKVEALKHRDTGAYMAGLKIEKAGRGKDRLVVAEGEGVIPIEFGGIATDPERKNKLIKPLAIMRKAYAAVRRV